MHYISELKIDSALYWGGIESGDLKRLLIYNVKPI